MVNGLSTIALTKLDVLDAFDEIGVCVAYRFRGETVDYVPSCIKDFGEVEPVYETFPGWSQSTVGVSRLEDLPERARAYVAALESLVGVEIGLVSTGPERDETIIVPGGCIDAWTRS